MSCQLGDTFFVPLCIFVLIFGIVNAESPVGLFSNVSTSSVEKEDIVTTPKIVDVQCKYGFVFIGGKCEKVY